MRLFKLLFGLGLIIYFCVVVITRIPAGWGAHFLVKGAPNLQLNGISGTLWNGKAAGAAITIDGKTIDLGRLNWHLQPMALLQLKACALIRSDLLNGDVCRTAGGLNILTNVMVDSFPAKLLNDAMGAQLAGFGNITVGEFKVTDDGDIKQLSGNVTWQDAAINVGTGWFQLGSYGVGLSENGSGGLYADITDLEGEFKVNVRGDIKLRQMPKLNGTIHPKEKAPEEIKQALSIFAEPTNDGGFTITWPMGG